MVRTEISKCVIEYYFTVSNIVFLRLLCDEFINLPYEQRWKNFHLKYYDYHVRISFLLLILFCGYWLILPSVFFPPQGCWSPYHLFIIHKFECTDPGGSAVEVLCVRPLSWDCGFESRWGHQCLYLVHVMCCRGLCDPPIPRPG
jgi:hypothetical protein